MEEKSVVSAEITEALRRAIKSHAALRGETLNQFITRALQATLQSDKEQAAGGPVVKEGE